MQSLRCGAAAVASTRTKQRSCLSCLQMRGKFAELLAMDAREIGDLQTALHGLVVDYNNAIQNPRYQGSAGSCAGQRSRQLEQQCHQVAPNSSPHHIGAEQSSSFGPC